MVKWILFLIDFNKEKCFLLRKLAENLLIELNVKIYIQKYSCKFYEFFSACTLSLKISSTSV